MLLSVVAFDGFEVVCPIGIQMDRVYALFQFRVAPFHRSGLRCFAAS